MLFILKQFEVNSRSRKNFSSDSFSSIANLASNFAEIKSKLKGKAIKTFIS